MLNGTRTRSSRRHTTTGGLSDGLAITRLPCSGSIRSHACVDAHTMTCVGRWFRAKMRRGSRSATRAAWSQACDHQDQSPCTVGDRRLSRVQPSTFLHSTQKGHEPSRCGTCRISPAPCQCPSRGMIDVDLRRNVRDSTGGFSGSDGSNQRDRRSQTCRSKRVPLVRDSSAMSDLQ